MVERLTIKYSGWDGDAFLGEDKDGDYVRYSDYAKLEEACMNLYYAGYWSCDRECDEVGLWTALKNALGLKDGTSPKAREVLGDE